jgi:uncharacterized membrane protein YbhN (UPF0104 family)
VGAAAATPQDLSSTEAIRGLGRLRSARVVRFALSRRGRIVLTAGFGTVAVVITVLAARQFAEAPWPLSRGNPGLLVAAGALSLLGYGFKAYGWQRLFATEVRPQPLALAAASGGASVTGLVLPGRFDDVVKIAIVRRYPGCPACVRTLCLSIFMLGLIDSAALAPLAFAAAVLPGQSLAIRLGLGLIAAVGIGAAALVVALPRLTRSARFLQFRLGRWLEPRTTPLRGATFAWALVSACWITRAVALLLLLGALGVGYSLPLALLFLCASSAAAALPIGPGGATTQAGAGAAVLIASGAGVSEAVGVAVAVQALGVLAGGSILLFAAAWRAGLRFMPWYASRRIAQS